MQTEIPMPTAGETITDYADRLANLLPINHPVARVAECAPDGDALEEAEGALESIQELLDGTEWDSETCSDIADVLRDYGLSVDDPDDQ